MQRHVKPEVANDVAPTQERLARLAEGGGSVEAPVRTRKTHRRQWRVLTPVASLIASGDLSPAEAERLSQVYWLWSVANGHGPRITARYGEQLGGSTPVSQLTEATLAAIVAHDERLVIAKSEWKLLAKSIGPGKPLRALEAICGGWELVSIGHRIAGVREQRRQAAIALICDALKKMA